jgi:hypothetical protein
MKAGKLLKYFILLVVAGNLALAAYVFLGAATPKPTPMPNPNGYDDFVNAGQLLSIKTSDYDKTNRQELSGLISANGEALRLLHLGLTRECRAPDDYSPNTVNNLIPTLVAFKQSIFLLCAEGKLAQLEGSTNDAAKIYVDGVRFGYECSRGGVLINKLVGIACVAIALKPLQQLTDSLDAKQCAEAAHALEEIDSKAEPIENTLAQERNFARQQGGITGPFLELVRFRDARAIRQKFTDKFRASQIYHRTVMIAFAARAYELDKGKRPVSIAELVPAYLKAIPQDPVTGTNMVLGP